MMTRPGENWRFVALLSRRPWQMGDGGKWGMGGLLDWTGSLAVLFFPGATKDSSNWGRRVGRQTYGPVLWLWLWLWLLETWAAGLAHQRSSWDQDPQQRQQQAEIQSVVNGEKGWGFHR